jgi:hypothetical protein
MSVPSAGRGGKLKRAMGVQQALEWAFRIEKAQLELPPPKGVTEEGFGFGLEHILLQRAELGCKVDGGQYKIGGYTHPDAEIIAATVAGMPFNHGGIRMAIQVTELARAGLTPDWMPGAVPRCVPMETKNNQHGERAKTIVVGTERVKTRGKWRTVELLACPVTWRPHQEQIDSARRSYDAWWRALEWVRDGLWAGGMLREVEVTAVMPKAQPWAFVTVPEAAMHEDDGPVLREDQVRPTGDTLSMQPIPEAARVKRAPQHHFRLRVLAPDPGHHPGAGLPVDDIRHLPPGLCVQTWYTACNRIREAPDLPATFGIVDLFAGPGGLGEGFASLDVGGHAPFRIGISVEKEASAHRTLTLRAFLRACTWRVTARCHRPSSTSTPG